MKPRKLACLFLALSPLPLAAQSQLFEAYEFNDAPGTLGKEFGSTLAVDGSTLLVADEEYTSQGVTQSGAVFVYERVGGSWTRTGELVEPDPQTFSFYGRALALHGDTAVVGTSSRDGAGAGNIEVGQAWIFERDASDPLVWALAAVLDSPSTLPQGRFGTAVDVHGDRVVVGSTPVGIQNKGSVYVYERDLGGPGAWGLAQTLQTSYPDNGFGQSVSLEGDVLAVGSFKLAQVNTGAAVVFEADASGVWSEHQVITETMGVSSLGTQVALQGDTLVVTDWFAMGNRGAVLFYERTPPGPGGTFQQVNQFVGPTSPNAGSLGSYFGTTLALSGDRVLVGAKEDFTGGLSMGSAYLFERKDGVFQPGPQLLASDPGYLDEFGFAVALTGSEALVGAPQGGPGATTPYFPDIDALALDSNAGVLYGQSLEQLIRIDPADGSASYVAPMGLTNVQGMAFDPGSDTLFGVNKNNGLMTIDRQDGRATVVGSLGGLDVISLAFDASTGWLYGATVNPPGTTLAELLRIDPIDASFVIVGPLEEGSSEVDCDGLAFDAESGLLYGAGLFGVRRIDPATAQAVTVGSLSKRTAMADRAGSALLTVPDESTATLEQLDVAGALVVAPIGVWGSTSTDDPGAVYVHTLPTIDTAYCDAGLSALGCLAELSSLGVASATASSGFSLVAEGVQGNKDGLFYFGTNGRQANPWGNGTSLQCVVPPVWRGGLLAGTGSNGQCNGFFDQDLNARWCPSCPKPNQNPGVGATVQAQLWYRDPNNPSNKTSSLSNAIEFTVAP